MASQLLVAENDWLRGGLNIVPLPVIIELEFILMVEEQLCCEIQLSEKLQGAWDGIVRYY